MDPITTIATIAGVASAAIKLSNWLFDLVNNLRHAPKKMGEIARGIADAALVLHELRRMLQERRELFRRRLLRSINWTVRRVESNCRKIRALVSGNQSRLTWLFRQSRVTELLAQNERHRVEIREKLSIMVFAALLRPGGSRSDIGSADPSPGDSSGSQDERDMLREQAENQVRAVRQSLQELATDQAASEESRHVCHGCTRELPASEIAEEPEEDSPDRDEIAVLMYDAAFAPRIRSSEPVEEPADQPRRDLIIGGSAAQDQTQMQESEDDQASDQLSSQALVVLRRTPVDVLIRRMPSPSDMVDHLLAEWTTLTEDEIEEVVVERLEPARDREEPINFRDALGRNFTFPFNKCKTWAGAEELIRRATANIGMISSSVQNGHYDLKDGSGNIVLPDVWGDLVEPGWEIEMEIWPLDNRTAHQSSRLDDSGSVLLRRYPPPPLTESEPSRASTPAEPAYRSRNPSPLPEVDAVATLSTIPPKSGEPAPSDGRHTMTYKNADGTSMSASGKHVGFVKLAGGATMTYASAHEPLPTSTPSSPSSLKKASSGPTNPAPSSFPKRSGKVTYTYPDGATGSAHGDNVTADMRGDNMTYVMGPPPAASGSSASKSAEKPTKAGKEPALDLPAPVPAGRPFTFTLPSSGMSVTSNHKYIAVKRNEKGEIVNFGASEEPLGEAYAGYEAWTG